MFKSLLLSVAIFVVAGFSLHTNETFVLLCFGYVGILTHYIKKWSEKTEKSEGFELKKFVPSIILSFITTTVLVFIRSEIVSLFVFTKFGSFIVGFCGNSWFFGLIEKKISTINPNITNDEN
jgi:hypothetical protein